MVDLFRDPCKLLTNYLTYAKILLMPEFQNQNPEQTLPVERQRPPVFTAEELDAVLRARAEIALTRSNDEGEKTYDEYVMGVTYDGIVVSVDERPGRTSDNPRNTDDHFVIRIGDAAQLAQGASLSEEKLPYGTLRSMRRRDGGTTDLITEDDKNIYVPAPQKDELPRFDGKVLFPIDEDGKLFSPAAAKTENEKTQHTPVSLQPERVVTKGLRNFLRRRHK